ncbi:hypothetical protein BASA82_000461 [Batrachochytrium salamandrivorans]|nr:hypothetical protein BASA82_000461 [Batrachochytrium salamandrivorans]
MPDLESVQEFSLEAAKQCKVLLDKSAYTGPVSIVLKTDGAKVPEKIIFWRAVEQINATNLPDEAATKILWDDWVGLGKYKLSRTGLREQLERNLHKRIMPVTLDKLMGGADKGAVTFQEFPELLQRPQTLFGNQSVLKPCAAQHGAIVPRVMVGSVHFNHQPFGWDVHVHGNAKQIGQRVALVDNYQVLGQLGLQCRGDLQVHMRTFRDGLCWRRNTSTGLGAPVCPLLANLGKGK